MWSVGQLWQAYKLRWNRRRLLARSFYKRRQLQSIVDRTASIEPSDIIAFCCVRNELHLMPAWFAHYRKLGVQHFLIVDNASDDGTAEYLAQQRDVSLWNTTHSYRKSRFGMDWLGALMMRHGDGHWCLTVDADELLIYPDWESRDLSQLTAFLRKTNCRSFGATMLDLYPKGRLSETPFEDGDDPVAALGWFDAFGYWVQKQPKFGNLWLQGGPRARKFFSATPEKSPTLNKVPLVDWSRRYSYVSSTHTILPKYLNETYDQHGATKTTGILLHLKFLNAIVDKSKEELSRQQHFADPQRYKEYYGAIIDDPILWDDESIAFVDAEQLIELGLMQRGSWN